MAGASPMRRRACFSRSRRAGSARGPVVLMVCHVPGSPAMLETTLPVFWAVSTWRAASMTSLKGYMRSMTARYNGPDLYQDLIGLGERAAAPPRSAGPRAAHICRRRPHASLLPSE